MKNSTQYVSLILSAGVAGVLLFAVANASFTAALRGDVIVAIGASLAIVGIAVYDYARQPRSLSDRPARVLRPALPVARTGEANASHKQRLAA